MPSTTIEDASKIANRPGTRQGDLSGFLFGVS